MKYFNKYTRKLGVLAVVFTLAVSVTACGTSKKNDDVIKIGANFELSGAVSSYGTAEYEGAKLAVDEINANGGILGKQVELVKFDNKSDASEVASVATRLATEEKVSAIVGPATSGNMKAAIPASNDAKVPVVSPSATDDSVTIDRDGVVLPYAFRICFQDSFQGTVMAKFANDDLGAKNALIISDSSSDYAKGLASTFKSSFKGTIVGEESYVEKDTDFSALVTKVKNLNYDVIFIPGYYAEVGLLIKQLREAGVQAPIVGGDGFDSPELVNLAGASNLNKVYFSAHYSTLSADAGVKDFMKAFEDKYKKQPNAFSALSYDSVYMVKDAIEKAGDASPEKVAQALASTKDFKGVTGVVTVDEKHNAVKSATVVELVNGEQANATVVAP